MPHVRAKSGIRVNSGLRNAFLLALVVVAVVVCFIVAWGSGTDLEKLQGKWILREMNGEFRFYVGTTKEGRGVITFDGDQFRFDNGFQVSGTFNCDPHRSPKQITFVFNGHKVIGIYSIFSKTLRIAVGKDDETPPGSFSGGPASRPALLIFNRAADTPVSE
jgi:uncharacterized protein (TIGR03067 family)